MIIQKKHKIPLYGDSFTVIIYESDAEFEEKFKDVPFEHPIGSWDGGVFTVKDHTYIVFSAEKKGFPTPGIVAHESKHLVNRIFTWIGQNLDPHNDECECYLLSWIVNRVHESINELNHKRSTQKQTKNEKSNH